MLLVLIGLGKGDVRLADSSGTQVGSWLVCVSVYVGVVLSMTRRRGKRTGFRMQL